MLGSPVGAVVGASDLDAMAQFFQGFGFAVVDTGPGYVELASAERGCLRVVPAPPGQPRAPLHGGLAALDLYARSVADRPSVTIVLGPLVMHQARVTGPDGLPLVLIEANHRRRSRLDTSDAEFSEAHSMVWVVPSMDEALPLFRDAGLTVVFDLPIDDPAVSEVMGFGEHRPVRMAMLSDADLTPMRFELLQLAGAPPSAAVAAAGGAWPWFEVADLDAALRLPWTSVERLPDGRARCVAPGGVLVELSESPP